MKIAVLSSVVLAVAVSALAQRSSTRRDTLKIGIDGTERRAIVFGPVRDPKAQTPLVLVFHGAGDTAENFTGVGFHEAWPEAVVVYAQGLERTAGGGGVFQTTDSTDGNPDLKFVDAIITRVRQQSKIDDSRIYATGFSNGAKFVYLLWATRSHTFAAFAPVAGMLMAKAPLGEPRPFIHIGGRADHQNEFAEQVASIEQGRARDGATGAGEPCGVDCTLYNSSRGTPVMTILHPAGHVYPAWTTGRIVSFFREHPLARTGS